MSTGGAAAGIGGAQFSTLGGFKANRWGDIAFNGTMSGVGIDSSNDAGLWTKTGDVMNLIAREGDLAPGAPDGMQFIRFDEWELNTSGTVAVHAHWTGSNDDRNEGIWQTGPNGLQLIARTDAPAPGVDPPMDAGGIFYVSQNDAGDIGFGGVVGIAGGGGPSATWFYRDGEVHLVTMGGMQAPGMPDNYRFSTMGSNFVATESRSLLQGTEADGPSSYLNGIWKYTDDELELIVSALEPVPGFPTARDLDISRMSTNRRDEIAFAGWARVGTKSTSGIWGFSDGELRLLHRAGDTAPDAGPGAKFLFFESISSHTPAINDRFQLLFGATIDDGRGSSTPNRHGIWTTVGGETELVVREGDVAPGTTAKFTDPLNGWNMHLNTRGQILFDSQLQLANGVTAANDRGLWATDLTGVLQLIVQEGDQLELAPGDLRTVASLGNSALSERGEVIFWAEFTDQSVAFLRSYRVAVLDGDFNADGVVDTADYVVWRDQLGTENVAADGNLDGEVNTLDYQIWKTNFGNQRLTFGGGSVAFVPEPASIVLTLGLTAALTGLRRRMSR